MTNLPNHKSQIITNDQSSKSQIVCELLFDYWNLQHKKVGFTAPLKKSGIKTEVLYGSRKSNRFFKFGGSHRQNS
jgi:hypothetical protein